MYDYLKDPAAIYEKSFATVREETDLRGLPNDLAEMIIRVIHACGMPEIKPELRFTNTVATAAGEAIRAGKPILCDCEMLRNGIIQRFLHSPEQTVCTLNDPSVPEIANTLGTTRSAAAIELWKDQMEGAVAVFGNAPTALFHLLEMLQKGAPKPAAILGFPVGFVGAAESKEALASADLDIPYITLLGRKGGSAMAAAATNAAALSGSKI
ncbi:precorrin-8X methylmutase [Sneathiella limimaris]|uniref:precorrin-8X methylmutase n=1 Tax=Sneathiella limimaris TaxID=1964213 RepID=UPI00146E71CA|nr:precorrin-8X methylmutase [Sneathiella limimaris]